MSSEDTSSSWLAGLWPFGNSGSSLKDHRERISKFVQPTRSTEFRSNADENQSFRSDTWLWLAHSCKPISQEMPELKGSCVSKSGTAGEGDNRETELLSKAKSHLLKRLGASIEEALKVHGLVETLVVVGRHYPKEAATLLREHMPTPPSTPGGPKTFLLYAGGVPEEWSVEEAATRILNIYLHGAGSVDDITECSDPIDSLDGLVFSPTVASSEDSGDFPPLWTLKRPSGRGPPVRCQPRSLWELLELATTMWGCDEAWIKSLDDETAPILCWPSLSHLKYNEFIEIDPNLLMTTESKEKLFKSIRDSVSEEPMVYVWRQPVGAPSLPGP